MRLIETLIPANANRDTFSAMHFVQTRGIDIDLHNPDRKVLTKRFRLDSDLHHATATKSNWCLFPAQRHRPPVHARCDATPELTPSQSTSPSAFQTMALTSSGTRPMFNPREWKRCLPSPWFARCLFGLPDSWSNCTSFRPSMFCASLAQTCTKLKTVSGDLRLTCGGAKWLQQLGSVIRWQQVQENSTNGFCFAGERITLSVFPCILQFLNVFMSLKKVFFTNWNERHILRWW